MADKVNILGIAPYEGMQTIMQNLAHDRTDLTLTTFVGDLQKGVDIVTNSLPDEYDVIISRGGTAEMIHTITHLPVIEITLSVYDILRAIKLAENYSKRYAIVGFPAITKPAKLLCDLLRYDIDIYTVKNEEDVTRSLLDLKKNGYHMVLSDMITYTMARSLELHSILITSGEESIEDSFDQAIRLCLSYAASREYNKILADTINSQKGDTVILRENGSVFFSSCNINNEELVISHLTDMQNNIEKLEKTFQQIGNHMFEVTASPIITAECTLTSYYLEPNPVPPLSSKYGLRYTNQKEVKNQLIDSFYNVVLHNMQPILAQVNELRQPIVIVGEEGTCKTDIAYLLYIKSTYNTNPMVIIDCALLNDKNWRFLVSHYNSPFCSNDNTIYISNLNELSETRKKQLLSTIIDIKLCSRNRVIFSWTIGNSNETALPAEYINKLSCIALKLPTLREHIQDLPSIASLYLNTLNMELSKQIIGFDPKALDLLCGYHWPANYTQLKRILTELVIRTTSPYINSDTAADILKKEFDQQYQSGTAGILPIQIEDPFKAYVSINKPLAEITKDIINYVVDECEGNQTKAAKKLGISRTTLWRYIK